MRAFSLAGSLLIVALAAVTLAGAAPRRSGGARTPTDVRSLIRAQVTSVDRQSGRIVFAGDGPPLDAVFSPEVVARVNPGDVVFVTLNVIGTRRATITGSVTAVDAEHGNVTLALPTGSLTVPVGPVQRNALEAGDPVIVKVDLLDIGPSADPGR